MHPVAAHSRCMTGEEGQRGEGGMRREEEVEVEQRGGRERLRREAWGKNGEKQHMAEKEAKEGLCRQRFQ